ncbi:hypothetical protein LJY25_08230 [Hymenobacter sp. BT175]|uniref:hypothetical protein n=1 Tax=Hymenobacter translucens TaxID=2886507 RepID=UPI001D0ED3FE|nr:hypothetical protein [Hymenobacter translucens]MCC2546429.1 hypothetical protein [Hymenobacter translucens]
MAHPLEMERDVLLDFIVQQFRDNENEEITPAVARQALFAIVYSTLVRKSDTLSVNQLRGGTHLKANLAGRDAIPFELRVLNMECHVLNPVDAGEAAAGIVRDWASYQLVPDSSSTLTAFTDADVFTTRKARWVLTSGSESDRIATYPEFVDEDHQYLKDDPIQFTFPSGAVRLFKARKNLTAFVNPAPTGLDNDPNWVAFAPLSGGGTAGPTSTDGLPEGMNNKYFTTARAIGALLTGYVKGQASRAIAATDSILVAIGLLERKADDNATRIGVLDGLTTTTKVSLVAALNEVNAKPAGSQLVVEQSLASNSVANVPSVKTVKDAIAAALDTPGQRYHFRPDGVVWEGPVDASETGTFAYVDTQNLSSYTIEIQGVVVPQAPWAFNTGDYRKITAVLAPGATYGSLILKP